MAMPFSLACLDLCFSPCQGLGNVPRSSLSAVPGLSPCRGLGPSASLFLSRPHSSCLSPCPFRFLCPGLCCSCPCPAWPAFWLSPALRLCFCPCQSLCVGLCRAPSPSPCPSPSPGVCFRPSAPPSACALRSCFSPSPQSSFCPEEKQADTDIIFTFYLHGEDLLLRRCAAYHSPLYEFWTLLPSRPCYRTQVLWRSVRPVLSSLPSPQLRLSSLPHRWRACWPCQGRGNDVSTDNQ